jgi:hypothetical protein
MLETGVGYPRVAEIQGPECRQAFEQFQVFVPDRSAVHVHGNKHGPVLEGRLSAELAELGGGALRAIGLFVRGHSSRGQQREKRQPKSMAHVSTPHKEDIGHPDRGVDRRSAVSEHYQG